MATVDLTKDTFEDVVTKNDTPGVVEIGTSARGKLERLSHWA